MASLNDTLFGPLGSQFCLYFYILAVLVFVFMVLTLFGLIGHLFSKKMDGKVALGILMLAGAYAITYVQNRLLYNMCIRSENVAQVAK